MLTRIKIEVTASQNKDDWLELFKVENRNETLGVHVNFVKGLRFELNSKGTSYAGIDSILLTNKNTEL